ncbi:unnamed protein product [Pipistrellus nathusii]|uniref:Uncharacterized protein n=1 Tax=Pipistrellus nathusii TaxID=59473 RepID=A0ABN9ZPU9_PIPNA
MRVQCQASGRYFAKHFKSLVLPGEIQEPVEIFTDLSCCCEYSILMIATCWPQSKQHVLVNSLSLSTYILITKVALRQIIAEKSACLLETEVLVIAKQAFPLSLN